MRGNFAVLAALAAAAGCCAAKNAWRLARASATGEPPEAFPRRHSGSIAPQSWSADGFALQDDWPAVVYIPGWLRCGRVERSARVSMEALFPGRKIFYLDWDGNRSWPASRRNADSEADKLAAELAALSPQARERIVLVGHSLGGRIAVRALARLAERGMKVGRAVVLAPAIPRNDPDCMSFAEGSIRPAVIVCNKSDGTLKIAYGLFGGEHGDALGLYGPPEPYGNFTVERVTDESLRQAELDSLWARSVFLRRAAAHHAAFYLEHLRKSAGRAGGL